MFNNYIGIPISSIAGTSKISRKIAVPVKKSHLLYAQFKYVYGYPASKDGASISKIQLLNTMIERLSKFKSKNNSVQTPEKSKMDMDQQIKKYEGELHLIAKKSSLPYAPTFNENGIIFNLVA